MVCSSLVCIMEMYINLPPLFKHSTIQSRQEQYRNVLLFVDLNTGSYISWSDSLPDKQEVIGSSPILPTLMIDIIQ